MVRGLGKTWLI